VTALNRRSSSAYQPEGLLLPTASSRTEGPLTASSRQELPDGCVPIPIIKTPALPPPKADARPGTLRGRVGWISVRRLSGGNVGELPFAYHGPVTSGMMFAIPMAWLGGTS
jgi:hypothetical protein